MIMLTDFSEEADILKTAKLIHGNRYCNLQMKHQYNSEYREIFGVYEVYTLPVYRTGLYSL